jgi:hypothetical protein
LRKPRGFICPNGLFAKLSIRYFKDIHVMPQNINKNQSKTLWHTWWAIIGPKLPQAVIKLQDNVFIAPLSADEFAHMKSFRAPVLQNIGQYDGSHVAHFPPRDEIQSHHKMQIDIIARDEDEACKLARPIADRLSLMLTLAVPGGRYYTELRAVLKPGDDQRRSPHSEPLLMRNLPEPDPLQDSDVATALHLLKATEQDEVAENAYVHILTAWQLQSTAGTKPLERSILQHYFLSIETVVDGVMAGIKGNLRDQIQLEERKFAKEFSEYLPNRADQPKAIREASTRLREMSFSNIIPNILKVSELLRIDTDSKDKAINLYKLRSNQLSHPGKSKKADLQKWLYVGQKSSDRCLADSIARIFFVRYCEYVS